MIVDIKIRYPTSAGNNYSLIDPVAAITDFSLEDQIDMWLVKTGLIKFCDYTPQLREKFTISHNS